MIWTNAIAICQRNSLWSPDSMGAQDSANSAKRPTKLKCVHRCCLLFIAHELYIWENIEQELLTLLGIKEKNVGNYFL